MTKQEQFNQEDRALTNQMDKPDGSLTWNTRHINKVYHNATYRYVINLMSKTVAFYDENYNYGKDKFTRGKDLNQRKVYSLYQRKKI